MKTKNETKQQETKPQNEHKKAHFVVHDINDSCKDKKFKTLNEALDFIFYGNKADETKQK